ncbi:hypothetical protein [Neobacillus rhizophilus]|uniref:Uncharacterized protein n=1 Tax=Neobacillus rhizophilus TaxID=2833579 RepID=A0A942YUZ6_9BACI|nr:hypothetical protein [Neobacillus rhizophilus]MBS4212475.1 hypothetical protein [Neobacillus rhizophilus]
MKKASENEIKRGQAISFRIPSDTPDHILKQLQKIKETERRNFSSKIASFVMEGVSQSFSREKETVTIPLPKGLTKAQRDWLKHEHSEALLGSILYQLISDPVRSTALLASLNSKAVDIDEALYLQENMAFPAREPHSLSERPFEEEIAAGIDLSDDDLDEFAFETIDKKMSPIEEEDSERDLDADDLLGGFLASMNK